jgi:ABC-type Fe3+-siderophore transport system permease subunit
MAYLQPIFITAIVFGFAYAVIHLLIRRKERMALIEKGADAPLFDIQSRPNITALKFGLLFIGVAIGLLLGSLLVETTTLNDEASYFSMVFLFGGIGLVVSHFLEKKEIREEKEMK